MLSATMESYLFQTRPWTHWFLFEHQKRGKCLDDASLQRNHENNWTHDCELFIIYFISKILNPHCSFVNTATSHYSKHHNLMSAQSKHAKNDISFPKDSKVIPIIIFIPPTKDKWTCSQKQAAPNAFEFECYKIKWTYHKDWLHEYSFWWWLEFLDLLPETEETTCYINGIF